MNQFPIGIAGIAAILAIAFALSSDRRAIRPRVVLAAFALQAGIAALVLYVPFGRAAMEGASAGVSALLGYAGAGTRIIFGPIANPEIGGNSFAISALPAIIFFASLVSILYHFGIMQFVIRWIGGAIEWVTGVSRVESLGSAANIFVGQSESPLVIRAYLAGLTPSQLFAVMTVGMAGVAGTILALYITFLPREALPNLLAASFMAAPGGLLMAKIMMPDARTPREGELPLEETTDPLADEAQAIRAVEAEVNEERAANVIEAAALGAQTGVRIAVAVSAMVLAFVALVALANGILGGIGGWFGYPELSFQAIVGTAFAPVMYLIGIPWDQALSAGGLFGTKMVLNEVVAFDQLGKLRAGFDPRSFTILTFALTGFANFSSIAIQMAATGSLAPNQRPLIAKLGVRALIAGSLANLMSAALAGLLMP